MQTILPGRAIGATQLQLVDRNAFLLHRPDLGQQPALEQGVDGAVLLAKSREGLAPDVEHAALAQHRRAGRGEASTVDQSHGSQRTLGRCLDTATPASAHCDAGRAGRDRSEVTGCSITTRAAAAGQTTPTARWSRSIVGQQLSVKAAATINGRVTEMYGG